MKDIFHHKKLKIVLILIRYFNPNLGIQIKVFEVTRLKEKTTDILLNYITKNLKKHKLLDTIMAFSGDICNTNFGNILTK